MYRQSEKNLLSSNTSSTCPANMVNFGPLTAEIGSGVWGPLQISTGFAYWQGYCTASSWYFNGKLLKHWRSLVVHVCSLESHKPITLTQLTVVYCTHAIRNYYACCVSRSLDWYPLWPFLVTQLWQPGVPVITVQVVPFVGSRHEIGFKVCWKVRYLTSLHVDRPTSTSRCIYCVLYQ